MKKKKEWDKDEPATPIVREKESKRERDDDDDEVDFFYMGFGQFYRF